MSLVCDSADDTRPQKGKVLQYNYDSLHIYSIAHKWEVLQIPQEKQRRTVPVAQSKQEMCYK